MTADPTVPQTEAGRTLNDAMASDPCDCSAHDYGVRSILAIEAEAREAYAAELREKVERLRVAAKEVVIQRGRYYRDGAEDPDLSVVPRQSLRRLDVALALLPGDTASEPPR